MKTHRHWLLAAYAFFTFAAHLPAAAADDGYTLDFRYAPPLWQTSICLPDDWQKTLVGKDGSLLYDYPGKFSGFKTRITAGTVTAAEWQGQELLSPRVPIVRTRKANGLIQIMEEAFAVPPEAAPKLNRPAAKFIVERVGATGGQVGWAKPPANTDPAFRNVAIGWKEPVSYRFKAAKGQAWQVVFGLCEGWHTNAGARILDLRIEGKTRQTVDLFALKGRNVPQLFALDATDENGDGWVDLEVAANEKATDKNTILNLLWVFRAGEKLDLNALLAGQGPAALAHVDCGVDQHSNRTPRYDVLNVYHNNPQNLTATITPTLTIDSEFAITPAADQLSVLIGTDTRVFLWEPFVQADASANKLVLRFKTKTLAVDQSALLNATVARGADAPEFALSPERAKAVRQAAEDYWKKQALPYGHLEVPDAGVQALLDSSIRNIYQAREIKKNLPAFQVGPTCYRGLWVVDGSFIMESVAYLDRIEEARNGIKYLMSFQREDGSFMIMDGHWKETGIVLWAVTRHAKLTGDQAWLREVWPKLEKGWAYITKMRAMPSAGAPNAGLIPDGFSDGGLADKVPEYTNIYWTLAGMRAAVEAARWLGLNDTAAEWQKEYDDFYQTFRRAAERDTKTDPSGNRYLPIRMAKGEGIPPQKAQWGFMHAVFPGKLFAANDPLVTGNMAMLKAVESEGLVLDTGWLGKGLWNYFGSFYAHGWLWLGDGEKAARTLYAFGNHASPLLVWREEHMPQGQGNGNVGDMPHNWASAEFIRLVRHALVLERGSELHLLEAIPPSWLRAGATTRVRNTQTDFGPLSMELVVNKAGTKAELSVKAPRRDRPGKIVVHVGNWGQEPGLFDLPTDGNSRRVIPLRTP